MAIEPLSGRDYESRTSGDKVIVLVKALDILSALAESEGSMALKDIVASVGITKSTCHRILKTLTDHGFVGRDPAGRYAVGIGAFQIGSSFRRTSDLRQHVLVAMQKLNELTEETIFLLIRKASVAVCLERIEGTFGSTLFLSIGGSLPLHTGAAPRVLLAFLEDDEVEAYIRSPLESLTSKTVTNRQSLRRDIQTTRLNLGCIGIDNVVEGMKAFGAPIFGQDEAVVGALSVGGLTMRIPESREPQLFDLVRQAAGEASAAMGSRVMANKLQEIGDSRG